MEKTLVFSFNIPTLEHQCECTYMHTTPLLLSYRLNWKLHSVVRDQGSDIATVQKQVKQFHVPLHLVVHSAYVHVQCDLDRRSYTNSSDEHFLTQNMFFGGMESKPAALPFHPLTQSCSANTTHSIRMWQHTYSSSPQKKKKNSPWWSTILKFNKIVCSQRVTMLKNCKHSPLHLFKLNHPNFLLKQTQICLKQCSIQGKRNK